VNPVIQKNLCALARHAGLELKFAEGLPTRFYGCQHTEVPIAVINSDQPQCEQIFTILHEIGHFELHCKKNHKVHIPALINRPYENALLSEVTDKARRVIRRKFYQEWVVDLWAICAFFEIGCPDDFKEFFQRHPGKMKMFPLIVPIILKARLIRKFKLLLKRVFQKNKTA
jgi:hypothetical protein